MDNDFSSSAAIFTTAAQLLDCVDKKLLLVLRDGRKMVGILRSFDQYANLVFQDTVERIYHNDTFADMERGILLVRGENVVLLGEIDLDKEDDVNTLKQVDVAEAWNGYREDVKEKKVKYE